MTSIYKRLTQAICISLITIVSEQVAATQFSAVYTASCTRDIGIIINVDDSTLQILQLDGSTKKINRFDIIYVAQYPVANPNIPMIQFPPDSKMIRITTRHQGEKVELLQGWMTDYSDTKVSFYTTNNVEEIVSLDDIWSVSFQQNNDTIVFSDVQAYKKTDFAHPYPFVSCEEPTKKTQTSPHRLINTALQIKEELDRLQTGYERIEFYNREKVFYPMPQIYTNSTLFSIGAGLNNRHGESDKRNSSLVPTLRNEVSDGIFDFQRVITTGSAPMAFSVHEEPQTQFSYQLKSGYVHSIMMYDLSQLLIGAKEYKWSKKSLETQDFRANERWQLGVGFDYRNYAIDYSISQLSTGVRSGDRFFANNADIGKVGLYYRNADIDLSFYYISSRLIAGSEQEEEPIVSDSASAEERAVIQVLAEGSLLSPEIDNVLNIFRFNLGWSWSENLDLRYSLLYKQIDFQARRKESDTAIPEELRASYDAIQPFHFAATGWTSALYGTYWLRTWDMFFTGFTSVETLNSESGDYLREEKQGLTTSKSNSYFKFGTQLGFLF